MGLGIIGGSGGGGAAKTVNVIQVKNSANQPVSNVAWTLFSWDTNEIASPSDTSMHNPATNPSRLTAKTTGPHWMFGGTAFQANAGRSLAAFSINGGGKSTIAFSDNTNQFNEINSFGRMVFLNAGDYVELWGQNVGASFMYANSAWFGLQYVGA